MRGLMQDYALTLPTVFDRFERLFGDKELVWSTVTERRRTSIAEWTDRTRRIGGVLDALDVPADAAIDVVGRLVSRSLVIVDDEDDAPAVRYRLLDSIRAFAREALADAGLTTTAFGAQGAMIRSA